MKKTLLSLTVLFLLGVSPVFAAFSDPFTSIQLAPTPSNGNCLTTNGTINIWGSCGSGGSGSPGGSNGDFQYNSSGSFAGTSTPHFSLFSFGKATGTEATTTSFFSTLGNFTNLFATNATVTTSFIVATDGTVSVPAVRLGVTTSGGLLPGLYDNSGGLGLSAGGTGITWTGSAFQPNTDAVRNLGGATNRWLTLLAVNSSTTNATSTNATTTTLAISSILSKLLKTNATGGVIPAVGDTDFQNPISLTTTGTSGAATFIGDVLNIPQYTGGTTSTGTTTDSYVVTTNGTTYSVYNQGDGYTNTSASFDTIWSGIMTDAGTASTSIRLGNGSFVTSNGLTITRGNISLTGQGAGATSLVAASTTALNLTSMLYIAPSTNTCAAKALTADATVGDLTLTLSTTDAATFSAGDYILLYSNLSIDTEFTGRNQGELHKILSVNSGTGVITLGATNTEGSTVFQTMTTANGASICKLNFLENITIKGITFTDLSESRLSTLSTGAILVEFARNVKIAEDQFVHVWSSAVHIRQTWDTMISENNIRNVLQVFPQTSNVFYGVQVRGAAINTTIVGNTFGSMRHAVTQGAGNTTKYAGTTRNLVVTGNTSVGTFVAHFDAHQGLEGCTYSNNVMIGDDGSANGIQLRSACTVTGNSIRGILGNGISLFGGITGAVVSNNLVEGGATGIQASNGARNLTITGNTLNGGTRGILFNRTSTAITISIASPAVVTDTAHSLSVGTEITFGTTGALPTGITAGTNYYIIAAGITPNSYEISTTPGGSAINTSGSQSGTQTRRYYSGTDSTITGNNILNETMYGIDADGQLRVNLSDNTFENNSQALKIRDTDSRMDGWKYAGNYFYNNTTLGTTLGTNTAYWGNYNGNGNFGISTSTPWKTLSVAGDFSLTGAFFDTTASPGALGSVLTSTITGTQWVATSSLGIVGGAASSTLLADNNTFSGNNVFSSLITGSVSGNAGTATALQNARTINGTSFNGTANITIAAASSTLLSDTNTFSGKNTFNDLIATRATTTNATTTSLAISGVLSNLLKTNGNGSVVAAVAGTDYLSTAVTSLNGQTGAAQTFATTSASGGWGFTSASNIHTLNIPTASATNILGLLSNTDWSTFNNKQGTVTLTTTGTSGAATFVGNTLNIPQYTSGGASSTLLADNNTFSGNNTFSSLARFTSGILATATSTIGDGTQAGGLTTNGGATTTGNAYIAGSLGIGTTTMTNAINVANSTDNPQIFFGNSVGRAQIGYPSAGSGTFVFGTLSNNSLGIRTNGITRIQVLNSGNVSIGSTNNNGSALDVTGQASSTNLFVTNNATATNATTTSFFATTASTTNFFGANLSTCNSASNALTYDGAGKFGCNTISAGSAASSTLLADNNAFTGLNTFSDLKLVTRSTTTQATTTNLFGTTGVFTNLTVTNAIAGSVTGNANTATTLATGRTFGITGDLTYTSPSFDGSGNVTAAGTLATVNSNVGSFGGTNSIPSFTVNGKGLITAASANTPSIPASEITTGTFGTGDYTFPANATVTSKLTATNASTTLFSTLYASSTSYFGAGLTTCNTAGTSALTWSAGLFGCNTISGGGAAYSFQGANNSTSTLTGFTGGLYATASSTIGNGTVTGGLTVSGTASTTNLIVTGNATSSQFNLTGTNLGGLNSIYSASANQLDFNTNGVWRGGFTSTGQFTVGTTTPTWTLTAASAAPVFELDDTDGATNAKHLIMSFNSGVFAIGTSSDSTLTSTSTALTVTPGVGSQLGVGTTSPWRTLSVVGTAAINGLTNSNTGDYVCINTSTFEIEMNTATCSLSSRRYKTDITPLSSELDTILALQPVSFHYNALSGKDTTKENLGLIAEDVEKVLPQAVTYDNNQVAALDWNQFISPMIKSIQELNAKIETGRKSAQDKWQDILIALLILGFGYQQWQIKKLKQ